MADLRGVTELAPAVAAPATPGWAFPLALVVALGLGYWLGRRPRGDEDEDEDEAEEAENGED